MFYNQGMETKTHILNSEIFVQDIPSSLPCGLTVINGPHAASAAVLRICAALALHGPVRILDCGNRSDMHRVAKELRLLTCDPASAMKRIDLSRAFTCYQAEALLGLNRGLSRTPILVFDLLATYLDESISKSESERLLDDSLDHLRKMSTANPVLVSVSPFPPVAAARAEFFQRLCAAADDFIQLLDSPVTDETTETAQLSLF